MFKWIKSGEPWVWLTGGAVSLSLLAALGLLLLIGWKGLTYFWPSALWEWHSIAGERIIGQLYDKDVVLASRLPALQKKDRQTMGEEPAHTLTRLHIKVANRDIYPSDFISLTENEIASVSLAYGWAVIDREYYGQFFGRPEGYLKADGTLASDMNQALESALAKNITIKKKIALMTEGEVQRLNRGIEALRLEKRKQELEHQLTPEFLQQYQQKKNALHQALMQAESQIDDYRDQLKAPVLLVRDMKDNTIRIPVSQISSLWYPDDMSFFAKVQHWGVQVWHFLSEDPRESNSEGGVFPAIFGTILLVIIMAVIVMPLGVVAAVYLHEYAKNNFLTRLIRVSVMNLAGVPSIVYGVFGLGFFVYTIGGSVDQLFYPERLPAPTFGTPGLLWSALTLAVLTLPVVIVATEEGLSRVPVSVRHGSLALGATQFETIWKIVIPMASPAMITGLILAIARAAGEVAPLMLVGVVKFVSRLPVDDQFPYLHLERKFMHLGFHIYDVGFQTSNIEAARPLVFATSFLLVAVIIMLNMTAISIRNNLREKYRTMGQD
ncbi:Phosphate transport system permease protein PstA [Vibrio aerogenes CECT 7868]|uniref:Phosphate transport system permease protein PstA n=1 Tax=Vibrio aerogenes CECT 7868 TaxID=1216006 RepID=A0A1M5YYD8_9VIBR|nr:phosphate ABC transporter permease PstA [Vibrio aerogenes]SHI17072.1 Phosphate transport system permease protein PstA [Vibrio aerogenes CECT 7868]